MCVDFFTFLILSRPLSPSSPPPSPSSLFLQQVECVPQAPLQMRKQEVSLKARGSTGESWSRVPQAAAGSDCPLGDRGSGPATCSLGYSPRCTCTTSAPLLPLVSWVTLGHGQEAPFGLGTFAPSNVPMTSRSCCRVEFPTTPSPNA